MTRSSLAAVLRQIDLRLELREPFGRLGFAEVYWAKISWFLMGSADRRLDETPQPTVSITTLQSPIDNRPV